MFRGWTFLVLVGTGIVSGAVPSIDGIFPCGAAAGGNVEVSLSGKAEPWPPKFWCSNPGVRFEAGEKAPVARVEVDADAALGPCLVRVWNDEGSSRPIIFVVGKKAEPGFIEDEKTDNGSLENAVRLEGTLPRVVYGRLNPREDVDCYSLSLERGQTLLAYLESHQLRTGNDPILHLYNPKGERVALAHDNAVNLDPELRYAVESDGNHTLALMAIATPPNANVSFHGSTRSTYRLNLALTESDLPERLLPHVGAPDTDISAVMALPIDLFGTLSTTGEVDRIRFSAKAKERVFIEAKAFAYRFPTDPVIVVEKQDGTTIREVDDVKPDRDSSYTYSIPADGEYAVSVRDRFGEGGSGYRYHFRAGIESGDFEATVSKSEFLVEAGKDLEVKVKVNRVRGHKVSLDVQVKGLPDGVSCENVIAPEKSGDAVLKFLVAEGASAFSGPFRIEVVEKEGGRSAKKTAVFSFQDADARGPYLIDDVEDLWLTVKEKEAVPEE